MMRFLVCTFNLFWMTYYNLQKWFFPAAHRNEMRSVAKELQRDKHFTLKSPKYQRAVNILARD